jgi:hypothetical protein
MDQGSGIGVGDDRRRGASFRLRLAAMGALIGATLLSGCRGTQPDTARESAPALAVGDAAPEFSLQAADGSEVTLHSVTSGRPALFYFSMGPG